jgi:protein SCO1/2
MNARLACAALLLLAACGREPGSTADALPDASVWQLASTWIDQDGKAHALADFRGDVQIAVLMFTSCTYACPRIVADLKAIEQRVQGLPDVRFLLFSIDDVRDRPERLATYAREQKLDARRWTLLHGDAGAVRELAAVLGFQYRRVEGGDFEHSNAIFVLDQQGTLAFRLDGLGSEPRPLVDKVASLVSQ